MGAAETPGEKEGMQGVPTNSLVQPHGRRKEGEGDVSAGYRAGCLQAVPSAASCPGLGELNLLSPGVWGVRRGESAD